MASCLEQLQMRAFSSESCTEASAQLMRKPYLGVRMGLKSGASACWNCPGCWCLVDSHTFHPPVTLLPARTSPHDCCEPWGESSSLIESPHA